MADEKEQEQQEDGLPVFTDEQSIQEVWMKIKGQKVKYFLREMSGQDLGRWQAYDASRISVTRNRIDMAPDAFKDYCSTLISMCMFEDPDASTPVPKTVIRGWPSSAINGLFDLCQTINGLNSEGRDKAKKA